MTTNMLILRMIRFNTLFFSVTILLSCTQDGVVLLDESNNKIKPIRFDKSSYKKDGSFFGVWLDGSSSRIAANPHRQSNLKNFIE